MRIFSLSVFSAFMLTLFAINKSPAQTYNVPEILYYKFNQGATTTPNYAIPGRGFATAIVLNQQIGPNGQFDSALVGVGGTGSTTYTNTGWVMDIGTSSWTISFWINNYTATGVGYLFGNDFNSSFRCFGKGASGPTGIRLDGDATFDEIDLTGVLPGPGVVHLVYDSSTAILKGYVNGVLQTQVQQQPLNLISSVQFKVGSYHTNNGLPAGTLMDEFRFYSRALDSAEIAATWNQTLPHTVTSVQQTSGIADSYKLSQNYPNPFNPETKIDFSIARQGFVNLKVYNSIGQQVQTLVNKDLASGNYSVTFSGAGLTTGIYYYTLITDGFTETKKMLLVK